MTIPKLERILLTEDEPDIQLIAKFALEHIGKYTIALCSSGKEALAQVVSFKPDLIILDVMMPVMDGPTTLKALRQLPQSANTPIVFMTAKVQPDEISDYRTLGAIAVINKPFDAMKLSAKIQAIWEKYHEQS
jgi:two-component system, OmpR family, response regulator